MNALRASSTLVKSTSCSWVGLLISFILIPVFGVVLRNNEKLPSLSLPLNLNLNYENLLFSSAKVLLFFYSCKFFIKKMLFLTKNSSFFT
jgi:hypothetical protein